MVMRKLAKIEDVKMADARNEEGGDGDEDDHGKEDGSDDDSEEVDANSTASSATFNLFDPSPHLPRPVPTSFLHASLHTPKPQPPKALPSSPLGFYPGISLSPAEPLPTLPSNLSISSYTLSNLSLPGSAAAAAHAGSSTPRDQTLQTVFFSGGQARKSRLVTSTDAEFCEGVRTWPQLAALATLTINNAAFESRELEDVVFYCGVQLTMLKLHNVELVFSCGG
jgi:hypothetical protein